MEWLVANVEGSFVSHILLYMLAVYWCTTSVDLDRCVFVLDVDAICT